jgi:hypothetical protein
MKLLILIGALATGTVFLVPRQKNITGTWVLDTKEKKCEAAVLRIQLAEGYYAGKLDIPEQQVYDKPVAVQIRKEKVKIWLDDKKTCFIEATISDSVLVGNSVVDHKSKPVKFYKARS